MKRWIPILFFLSFLMAFPQNPDLDIELFASGLSSPVNIKHAGDDRLFVVERAGFIRIVNSDGSLNPTAFLDIDNRVTNAGGEQGLLGLAFHPDYVTNGYFFVNYINDTNGDTVISRFSRDGTNPSLADASSELIILTFNQPFSNHNGGDMAFGADGYLYISSGDGGSGNDPQDNAQDLTNLLGKLLRIDVNNSSMANPYAIPADNPFVGNASAEDEIWAYGLRNPWKFSFDSTTNELWIADVGQNAREEINLVSPTAAGLNYGWRCYEGTIESEVFDAGECPAMGTLTFPVAEYAHNAGRCSITGGYRYRGSEFPNFSGTYFFSDFCTGEIGSLTFNGSSWDMLLENFSGNWSAFGEANDGELYISDISTGSIYKLLDNNALSLTEETLDQIKLYPNPIANELNIDFSNYNEPISSITIFNSQGKQIKTVDRTQENLQKIEVNNFSKGLYIIKIENKYGNQLIKKLVVN